MNLEPIDTSTTAGKAEVMRLAAEGLRVAAIPRRFGIDAFEDFDCGWNWQLYDYAIIRADLAGEVS